MSVHNRSLQTFSKASIAIGFSLAVLSGCSTTSNTMPYDTTPRSTLAIQEASGDGASKVSFSSVSMSPGVANSLTCRAMGDIDVTAGKGVENFILEAFQEELLEAGAYSSSAPVVLKGTINKVDFSSVSPASWMLSLTLSGSNGNAYTVDTDYQFKTSWDAVSACRNVANAFTPATQNLVQKAVTHPQFKDFFSK